jgi:hypothetical protein
MSRISTHFSYHLLKELKGTICCNCGLDCKDEITYHHIVPISLGGNDVINNIVPLCAKCHGLIHHATASNNAISHSELIKTGLERARQNGKTLGRRKTKYTDLTDEIKQIIIKIKNNEIYKVDAAKQLGISRPTLDKYIRIFDANN